MYRDEVATGEGQCRNPLGFHLETSIVLLKIHTKVARQMFWVVYGVTRS